MDAFTNEIQLNFDFDALEKDFRIFRLSLSNKSYYKLFSVLNSCEELTEKFLSVHFDKNGNNCYVLANTNIKPYARKNNIECVEHDIRDVESHIIANLLLTITKKSLASNNACPRISNIDGKNFYVIPSKSKRKNEILAFEIRFSKGQNGLVLLSIDLVTFTNEKSFINKEKIVKYAKYDIDENGFLIRTNKKSDYYIMKKANKKKNSIDEFQFDDNKVKQTRIFAFSYIYHLMISCDYVLQFKFNTHTFEFVDKKYIKAQIKRDLDIPPINVINYTEIDELSLKFCDYLKNNGFEAQVGQKEDASLWNLILIDSNDETSDVFHHKTGIVKQCVVKDTIFDGENVKISNTVVENIINQLSIKNDLFLNHIRTFDFNNIGSKFEKITAYKFSIVSKKDGDKETEKSYCSYFSVDAMGNVLEKCALVCEDDYDDILFRLYKNQIGFGNSGYIFCIDNDSFLIKKNDFKVLPNIEKIHNRFFSELPDAIYEKEYFLNYLTELYNTKKSKKSTSSFVSDYEKMIEDDFFSSIPSELHSSQMLQYLSAYNGCYNEMYIKLYDDNDFYEVFFRRDKNTKENIFPIYTNSGFWFIEDSMIYFISEGNPLNSMNEKINNGIPTRTLVPFDNSNITERVLDIFLSLICVDFVKYRSYTVLPFLFKYINEIEMVVLY